ncbi:SDR family oxidoreductase [Streptomyces sp. NPDC058439]|uniref:SDR family oxidoreductase n=1 Tax=Streptomyces sp. NPDC058439 TaxID=3346500 RepID=UPI003666D3D0
MYRAQKSAHRQPNQASYAAAKEAIRGPSRGVANELATDRIRVDAVSPTARPRASPPGPRRTPSSTRSAPPRSPWAASATRRRMSPRSSRS